jgi:hypothetical protein
MLPFILVRTGGLPFQLLPQAEAALEAARLNLMDEETAVQAANGALLDAFEQYLKENKQESAHRKEIYNQRKRLHQGHAVQWPRLDLSPPACAGIREAQEHLEQAKERERAARAVFAEAHQREMMAAQAKIAEIFTENDQFRRGIIMNRVEIAKHTKQELLADGRLLRSAYRYITRAAAKTSPLSTFGVVQHLSQHATEAMPWEVRVERFHPNVFFRRILYQVLMFRPHYFKNIKWRLNPGLYQGENGQMYWPYYSADFEEFVQNAELDEAMTHLLQVLETGGAQTMQAWEKECVEKEVLTHEFAPLWLAQAIETGILLMTTSEDGLQGSWAKTLLNHLAFMGNEAPMPMIQMLNLWTKSGGQLPHMEAPQLAESLDFVFAQSKAYLQEEGIELQDFEPAILYSHDVQLERGIDLQIADFQNIAQDIATELKRIGTVRKSREHAASLAILKGNDLIPDLHFTDGRAGWSFLYFAQFFLQLPERSQRAPAHEIPLEKTYRVSALLQCYQDADGSLISVLNALGTGGGRLAGRYMNTFSAGVLQDLKEWNTNAPDEPILVAVREVADSNVNFHPAIAPFYLDWPNPMTTAKAEGAIQLNEVGLRLSVDGTQLELVHIPTEREIQLLECGLEARSVKTKLLNLLLQIGIPEWTREVWEQAPISNSESTHKIYPRVYSKSGQTILRRKRWFLKLSDTEQMTATDFYLHFNAICNELQVPEQVFAFRDAIEKPFFVDKYDPLSVSNLQIIMRTRGLIYLEEMLPLPHQLLVNDGEGSYVSEFVLEVKV